MKKKTLNKSKTSHLVLVRHGESEWNAKGLWTGWVDIPLSEKGKEEARSAAHALKDVEFHISFTSDLKRAYDTLEIIKRELQITHIPTIKHPDFKERHYGIYTGKNKWEIQKTVGIEQFKKLRRGWNVPIPKGESLKDVFERVIPKFEELIVPHIADGKNILFVAHGNSNRSLMKHLEGITDELIEEVEIATGEIMIYRLDTQVKIINKEKRAISRV